MFLPGAKEINLKSISIAQYESFIKILILTCAFANQTNANPPHKKPG